MTFLLALLLACSGSTEDSDPCRIACESYSEICDNDEEWARDLYDCDADPLHQEECAQQDPVAACKAECDRARDSSVWVDCLSNQWTGTEEMGLSQDAICSAGRSECGSSPCNAHESEGCRAE